MHLRRCWGQQKRRSQRQRVAELAAAESGNGSSEETALRGCEINARTVVEAMLFVGSPGQWAAIGAGTGRGDARRESGEIEAAVGELNSIYDADGAPYCIEQNKGGYRLVLRDEFQRMRDKFYGRVKEAGSRRPFWRCYRFLAYNQPATAEHLSGLRGAPSGAALSTLVRRRLVNSIGQATAANRRSIRRLIGF